MSIFINIRTSDPSIDCINEYLLENYNILLNDILLEDGSSIFTKIKESIITFFDKILEILKHIWNYLTSFVVQGEEFVKKYKDIIMNKSDKGFYPIGQLYDMNRGIDNFGKFNKITKDYIESIGHKIRTSNHDEAQEIDNQEYTNRLFSEFPNVHDSKSLSNYILISFTVPGVDQKGTYTMKSFPTKYRASLLHGISKFKDNLKIIKEVKTDSIEMKNKILSEFNRLESETKNSIEVSNLQKYSSLVKVLYTIRINAFSSYISVCKSAYNEHLKILRQFLAHTPPRTEKKAGEY